MKSNRSPPPKLGATRRSTLLETSPDRQLDSLPNTEQELKLALDYAEAIIESVPPLLILDSDLRVRMANKSFCKCFKISSRETVGCLVYELGNGQWDIPKLRTFLEEILPRHRFFKDFEVTHEFEAVGRRTVLLSGHQVDHLQGILLFIDDITERIDSRTVMRASVRYRRLFEAAQDGILIVDPKTRKITDANPFMSELLGYRHHELLGKELWEIGLLQDEAASRAAFGELQQKHFIRYEDLPLKTITGKHREVEFVSNLYEEDGHDVIQCNIRDITERKQAEKVFLKTKDEISRHAAHLEQVVAERTAQLRETIRELEGFSYSVSHDMRAPLRAMQSYGQFLVDEYGSKLDEKGVNYLNQITRSAVRLDHLIQDVLSYTKIIHSTVPIESVDLDRLVRDIIETYPNGHTIKAEISIKGKLPKVMGNEALLTQCVSNLLNNGAKFVSPGTTPRLEVSAEAMEEPHVRVWFRDNGIGIAPENHERIFRLLERIHPTTEYEGTGIGLTIVHKATERMGAQVGFNSTLGTGSHFWIQLKKG